MTLIEVLHKRVLAMREQGYTNKEIANNCGLSQQHVNYLLNGSADRIGSLKFSTILRLFPEINDLLEKHFCVLGDGNATALGGSAASINGNATVNHTGNADLTAAADRIMESDMCDACKVKAWKLLRASGESAE